MISRLVCCLAISLSACAFGEEPSFFERTIAIGENPTAIVKADFNNDRVPDLATANRSSDTVSVAIGNGDGTFFVQNLPVGDAPGTIVSADFNGDGFADLATGNRLSNNVAVLLGDGTGAFSDAEFFATGNNPQVATGDFNNDGVVDLATANTNSYSVSFLLGDGDGTFTLVPSFGHPSPPRAIATIDFGVNDITDLAVLVDDAISNGGDRLIRADGNGSGSFSLIGINSTGVASNSITKCDLNQDGVDDLVLTNHQTGTASVYLHRPSGLTLEILSINVGENPLSATTADFNGDGMTDLVTAGGSTISIVLRNEDGTFAPTKNLDFEQYLTSIVTGDFNLDGFEDLAVTNSAEDTLMVLLNLEGFGLQGDLNGDGLVDLLDVSPFVSLLANGEFQTEADINGDGAVDLLDVQPFVNLLGSQ